MKNENDTQPMTIEYWRLSPQQLEKLRDIFYKQWQHKAVVKNIAIANNHTIVVEYLDFRHPDFYLENRMGEMKMTTI